VAASSIVNISSIYGLIGSGTSTAYHASKGAVRILTKTAAVEYARDKIRVKSVHPGVIKRPMMGIFEDKELDAIAMIAPMMRGARPEEVGYVVLFLATDEASFVTVRNMSLTEAKPRSTRSGRRNALGPARHP
jgi:3alpha(or 20beta)-hydroxysteroid dehydrogenase